MLKDFFSKLKSSCDFIWRVKNWPVHIRFLASRKLNNSESGVFFLAFSMFAKLIIADRRRRQEEVDLLDDFMTSPLGLDSKTKIAALKVFQQALVNNIPFSEYAEAYYQEFKGTPIMLEKLLDLLIGLAWADDDLGAEEAKLLKQAQTIFKISEAEYQRILSNYDYYKSPFESRERNWQKRTENIKDSDSYKFEEADQEISELEHYLRILGCNISSSDAEVKQAYRSLVKKHHPDKLRNEGLTDEFLAFSKQRFLEIQEAYEFIEANKI